MSPLTALLVVAAAALVGADLESMKQNCEFCKGKFPVTDENIMYAHKNGVLKDENDENARCYMGCMMDRMGKVMDDGGNFDPGMAKKNIIEHNCVLYGPPGTKPPAQAAVDAAVDQCKDSTGPGKCMTPYKIYACLYTKLHAATGN